MSPWGGFETAYEPKLIQTTYPAFPNYVYQTRNECKLAKSIITDSKDFSTFKLVLVKKKLNSDQMPPIKNPEIRTIRNSIVWKIYDYGMKNS